MARSCELSWGEVSHRRASRKNRRGKGTDIDKICRNGICALASFESQPDFFDLVITDQTMPGITGIDLSRKMLQRRPDLPIILCTGYSSQVSEETAIASAIRGFTLKPLSMKNLAVLIRKILDMEDVSSLSLGKFEEKSLCDLSA
jgi:DNA-binding NtrC family response regulator